MKCLLVLGTLLPFTLFAGWGNTDFRSNWAKQKMAEMETIYGQRPIEISQSDLSSQRFKTQLASRGNALPKMANSFDEAISRPLPTFTINRESYRSAYRKLTKSNFSDAVIDKNILEIQGHLGLEYRAMVDEKGRLVYLETNYQKDRAFVNYGENGKVNIVYEGSMRELCAQEVSQNGVLYYCIDGRESSRAHEKTLVSMGFDGPRGRAYKLSQLVTGFKQLTEDLVNKGSFQKAHKDPITGDFVFKKAPGSQFKDYSVNRVWEKYSKLIMFDHLVFHPRYESFIDLSGVVEGMMFLPEMMGHLSEGMQAMNEGLSQIGEPRGRSKARVERKSTGNQEKPKKVTRQCLNCNGVTFFFNRKFISVPFDEPDRNDLYQVTYHRYLNDKAVSTSFSRDTKTGQISVSAGSFFPEGTVTEQNQKELKNAASTGYAVILDKVELGTVFKELGFPGTL